MAGGGEAAGRGGVWRVAALIKWETGKNFSTGLLAGLGGFVTLPVLGGVVGGALDAVVCRKVGHTAQQLFRPPAGAVLTGDVIVRAER